MKNKIIPSAYRNKKIDSFFNLLKNLVYTFYFTHWFTNVKIIIL